jgi:hypothetical protein
MVGNSSELPAEKDVPTNHRSEQRRIRITEVNNDVLELRCLEPNLQIAKKWARNALNHIACVLNPIQFTSALTDSEHTLIHSTTIEEWKPPPPPTIQFMPDVWKKDIPRTISKQDGKKQNGNRKTIVQKQDLDNDNNTTTTVNTQRSYTQDTISKLQNNSYQHQQLLEAHNQKIDALDQKTLHIDHYQQLVESHTKRLEKHESETPLQNPTTKYSRYTNSREILILYQQSRHP